MNKMNEVIEYLQTLPSPKFNQMHVYCIDEEYKFSEVNNLAELIPECFETISTSSVKVIKNFTIYVEIDDVV